MTEEVLIEEFYNKLKNNEIFVSKCNNCGKLSLPPRKICPSCNSTDYSWIKLKNEGEIESFTIIYAPPKSFKEEAPYAVCLVKLENKVKILGRIKISSHNEIKIKDKVRIVVKNKKKYSWPYWPEIFFEKL